MSDFLNDGLTQNDEPQPPTREGRAAEAAVAIKEGAINSTRAFVNAINANFDLVWNNSFGLTPGEVSAALGTDALSIFSRHAATRAFLIEQSSVLQDVLKTTPPGYTISYEMAGDVPTGRVTITEDV